MTWVVGATAAALGGSALLAACGDDDEAATSLTRTADDGGTSTTSSGSRGGKRPGRPNVYRLASRHNRRPCKACVAHNRNRYYATSDAALADRPHPGCSCQVRERAIDTDARSAYFVGRRDVYDRRLD